jgi:hypothetical protein
MDTASADVCKSLLQRLDLLRQRLATTVKNQIPNASTCRNVKVSIANLDIKIQNLNVE